MKDVDGTYQVSYLAFYEKRVALAWKLAVCTKILSLAGSWR
jgi:hypothetical protein